MSSLPIRVLLIEDNPGDARLLCEMLNEPGSLKAELTHFGCMSDALKHLAKNAANIILLDLELPDANGLAAVRQTHAAAPSTPLVVLTGLDDESLATQALQEGAQDYLIKGQIETHALLRALRYAIERQRMQVETDQVRRLQLQIKDEFLSHVSHELRSPLTAIYQFGTILADELAGGVTSDQRECLQIILRNVAQLQSMIGDLLEVTRAQEGKLTIDLECTSVSDAIAYTVKTLLETAKAKGVIVSFDLPTFLPLVYADPTRIRQILIILLDNAVKFTGPGGLVTARAQLLVEDPCFLLLEVADSGCGIGADMTERIFERLCQVTDAAQAGRKGLGLGLYICKELVTRQGGRIWVTSSPQGSVFSFTLPVFSLAQLMSPLLKDEEWPADSVALVTVEIRSPDGWISKETREVWARDTRTLLQRCLMPDLDVLLPKMGSSGPGELFQVVVFADDRGVAVLTKRIREQFQRLKHCKESGLTFSTSYRMLEQASANTNLPTGNRADEMATRIEDLIKSEALAGAVPHGQ
jgi:sigma-B regulation protein RsbU (phosphoserine phosphatase)